jgi:hypothetical protein
VAIDRRKIPGGNCSISASHFATALGVSVSGRIGPPSSGVGSPPITRFPPERPCAPGISDSPSKYLRPVNAYACKSGLKNLRLRFFWHPRFLLQNRTVKQNPQCFYFISAPPPSVPPEALADVGHVNPFGKWVVDAECAQLLDPLQSSLEVSIEQRLQLPLPSIACVLRLTMQPLDAE